MVSKMRDDSQSTFRTSGRVDASEMETLSALLLLVLSGAEEHQNAAPASERIVNLLSEMEAHPTGSATENAVRAGLITRLSAALTGLRAELD
jgi:hypothetical protein